MKFVLIGNNGDYLRYMFNQEYNTVKALRSLGHEVSTVKISRDYEDRAERLPLSQIITQVKSACPDVVIIGRNDCPVKGVMACLSLPPQRFINLRIPYHGEWESWAFNEGYHVYTLRELQEPIYFEEGRKELLDLISKIQEEISSNK